MKLPASFRIQSCPVSAEKAGGKVAAPPHSRFQVTTWREISRQARKNKSLKDIEEQHKKALEEDPLVFDYDGV
ncbi:hypothetical protein ES319_A05G082500v1 [Gossypium barbadense]|uniref:Uncharacterized protein n=1 Tax=Gossypium barbadense TaxID=3634 RepID=A0A2P5X286_GOSBA|nr:hypothetical protein ES319_A05G082500v1 [Gossypium barbadense]PPR97458.1 hypothetical protein GOBAR_AA23205 [Gossypium barbadense]